MEKETFNFGKALELLKEGKKVCRSGWNGKGMFLTLQEDQVIADLIEKNKRLAHKDAIMASETIKDLFKELRHHKYKRCLAMAKWCYAKWDDTATKYYKSVWYRKWEVKWLALAEKFKEGV